MSEEKGKCVQVVPTAMSRDQILAASDVQVAFVEIPEPGWSGVYVRVMTGKERDDFENATLAARAGNRTDIRGLRGKLLVRCICDKAGNRLFGDGDEGLLNGKNAVALGRITEAAQRLNGMLAADVEDVEGN